MPRLPNEEQAEYSQLKSGGRLYRVPIRHLERLPRDDHEGPYLGDENAGYALNALTDEEAEQCRKDFGGGPWTALPPAPRKAPSPGA